MEKRTLAQCTLGLLLLTLGLAAGAETLLVTNKSEASVSLIDLPGFETVATLPTGEGPHEVDVSPNGKLALVTNYGTRDAPGNTLTLIDIPRARSLSRITLYDGARPHGIQWLSNDTAVVTAEGMEALLIVDVPQRRVTEVVNIAQQGGHMVSASPARQRAYVANIGSGTASVIDLSPPRKVADLPSGEGTEGVALAAGGTQLWLTNRASNTVTVYATDSKRKLAEIGLEGFPIRAEADDARKRVYITLPQANALAVVSTETFAVERIQPFNLGPDARRKTMFGDRMPDSSIPVGVQLSGDGSLLFVAHTSAHVIGAYDPDSLERRALIPAGLEPDGMAWSPLDARP